MLGEAAQTTDSKRTQQVVRLVRTGPGDNPPSHSVPHAQAGVDLPIVLEGEDSNHSDSEAFWR